MCKLFSLWASLGLLCMNRKLHSVSSRASMLQKSKTRSSVSVNRPFFKVFSVQCRCVIKFDV